MQCSVDFYFVGFCCVESCQMMAICRVFLGLQVNRTTTLMAYPAYFRAASHPQAEILVATKTILCCLLVSSMQSDLRVVWQDAVYMLCK